MQNLAITSRGLCKVFVVYDCCRSKNAKGISRSRGLDIVKISEADKKVMSYIALAGTISGKTVPESSNLSRLIIERMNSKAAANGLVRLPEDLASFTGDRGIVEKTMLGPAYHLRWNLPNVTDAHIPSKAAD